MSKSRYNNQVQGLLVATLMIGLTACGTMPTNEPPRRSQNTGTTANNANSGATANGTNNADQTNNQANNAPNASTANNPTNASIANSSPNNSNNVTTNPGAANVPNGGATTVGPTTGQTVTPPATAATTPGATSPTLPGKPNLPMPQRVYRQPLPGSAPVGTRPAVATQPPNAPPRALLKYYGYLVNKAGLTFNDPLEFPMGAGILNAEDVIQFTTKTTPSIAVLVAKYRNSSDMTLGNERFAQLNTDNRKLLQKNNYIVMVRGGDEAFYNQLSQGLEKFDR
jgi:hypothetical protein